MRKFAIAYIFWKGDIMVTETFCMQVEAVGTDDGRNTFEIRRKWGEEGKKSLVIELYPTLTTDKCGNMDISTMHLLNHAGDFGWNEIRIVNLYSKVFSTKPSVSQLTDNDSNLSYIEAILEEDGIRDYDIVVAWGNSLVTHTKTIHAKVDLLSMIKEKKLVSQVKCIVTDNFDNYGIHPLYLGLRYTSAVWKLKKYPVEKMLAELQGEKKKIIPNADLEGDSKKTMETSDKEKKGVKKSVSKNRQ